MTYWVQGYNVYVITLRGIYENDETTVRQNRVFSRGKE